MGDGRVGEACRVGDGRVGEACRVGDGRVEVCGTSNSVCSVDLGTVMSI